MFELTGGIKHEPSGLTNVIAFRVFLEQTVQHSPSLRPPVKKSLASQLRTLEICHDEILAFSHSTWAPELTIPDRKIVKNWLWHLGKLFNQNDEFEAEGNQGILKRAEMLCKRVVILTIDFLVRDQKVPRNTFQEIFQNDRTFQALAYHAIGTLTYVMPGYAQKLPFPKFENLIKHWSLSHLRVFFEGFDPVIMKFPAYYTSVEVTKYANQLFPEYPKINDKWIEINEAIFNNKLLYDLISLEFVDESKPPRNKLTAAKKAHRSFGKIITKMVDILQEELVNPVGDIRVNVAFTKIYHFLDFVQTYFGSRLMKACLKDSGKYDMFEEKWNLITKGMQTMENYKLSINAIHMHHFSPSIFETKISPEYLETCTNAFFKSSLEFQSLFESLENEEGFMPKNLGPHSLVKKIYNKQLTWSQNLKVGIYHG